MNKIGFLYETQIGVETADKLPLLCKKGLKLKVVKDCFDESYLHELTHYWREGLKEKKLKEGSIVEVLGYWSNCYGSYIKCTFNNETFDINPRFLSFSWDYNDR